MDGQRSVRQLFRRSSGKALDGSRFVRRRRAADRWQAQDLGLLPVTAMNLFMEKTPGLDVQVMPFRVRVLGPRMPDVGHRHLHRPEPVDRLQILELPESLYRRKEVIRPSRNREDRYFPALRLGQPILVLVESAAEFSEP